MNPQPLQLFNRKVGKKNQKIISGFSCLLVDSLLCSFKQEHGDRVAGVAENSSRKDLFFFIERLRVNSELGTVHSGAKLHKLGSNLNLWS